MIVFENIDNGQTVGIDRDTGGKFYRAKLSAVMNSSNLSPNADRGQDFGYRLIPEQQALIEEWERDPDMIEKVSNWSKVMVDDLTHAEFLSYLLYQQELGKSPERASDANRREAQKAYDARVAALKSGEVEAMPAFDSKIARGEATVEDFLNGDVTGDAGGDKVEDEVTVDGNNMDELEKAIAETEIVDEETPAEPKKPATKKPSKK